MFLGERILSWYYQNQRVLPWRKTKDPYKVWVSEIILQQTRINQGTNYYHRFLETFPDIEALAYANLDDLMKVWQGLGYYSRARNMHQAAKEVIQKDLLPFPDTYEKILSLKGIGDYTAAAIASIVFNEPVVALDGNVLRLGTRLFGIKKPVHKTSTRNHLKKLLTPHMVKANAGDFNQALIELGAILCSPRNPACSQCPLADTCIAFNENLTHKIPVKTQKISQHKRYFYYFFIENNGYTYLQKRTKKDIWHSLYEFPLLEIEKPLKKESLFVHSFLRDLMGNNEIFIKKTSKEIIHILSHQKLHVRFIYLQIITEPESLNQQYIKVHLSKIPDFPVPKLIENYISSLKEIISAN